MKKLIAIVLAVLVMFTLVACGGQKDENGENTDPPQQTADNGGDDYTFDVKEDDHTVIIYISNTYQVFTHDGVNVTGYTIYTDCGDAETARMLAASVIDPADEYYAGSGVKSVTCKGKYLVQNYDEKGFLCKTYEELHTLAEQYRLITE